MPPPDDIRSEPPTLPAELLAQFRRLEARLQKFDTALALCGAVAAPLLMLGVLWLSDRFWDTPAGFRFLLAVAAFGGVAVYVIRWTRRWVLNPPDLRALAMIVQRHHRRLGDRLLGVVELASEQKLPDGMSPSLCRAAINQVSTEALKHDFEPAADPLAAHRHGMALAAIALPLLLVCIAVPQAGWNAFQRLALPLAKIDRFTFVELELAHSPLIVPHGESFPLNVKVHYRAFWKPTSARALYAQQAEAQATVSGGSAQLEIPGQTQPAKLIVRLGDAEAIVQVEPTHRPALKELQAAIKLPDYLQYPGQSEVVRGGTFNLLEGGKASFRGEVNRPIASARLAIDAQASQELKVSGTEFETEMRDWKGVSSASFQWKDGFGLTNRAPWTLSLSTIQDQPPTVSLPGMPLDQALLETEILPIKMSGQDDFGVREVGVHWMISSALDPSGKPVERLFKFGGKAPQTKSVEETYLLSPSLLRIPADTVIEVRGLAVDYLPGREPVTTEPHRIFVIGLVRHAEMLRQQLESLFAQLEEVTRREESIAAKTREVSDMSEEKLNGEEATKRTEEQAKQQAQNARDLEKLAQEGAKTMREAMRNPTFKEETIRDWARTLKGMQDVAKQEMQQAGQQLQSAQQQQNNSQQRSQELSKALESEQKALEKLQQMQQQVNKGLDQLQAQTLAQRLRKLGTQETQLTGRLQELVAETIGLLPAQLSEHHRRANTNISGDQEKVRDEAKTVHEEMSRFFDRTQRENYGAVSKEMKEANTESELDRARSLIASNVTMSAMSDLGGWAKRFEDWAKKLEPEKKDSKGGQSGNGGTPQDDLMKQLMALLRMRENENNVRQQTQLLERDRQQLPKYDQSVRELADNQKKLNDELKELQKENGTPQLDKPLDEAHQAMQGVETVLRHPNTGEVAEKAQTKAIEVLTDVINLINEQAQQQSQQSQSAAAAAQEMEFLRQMAQQQPGQGSPMLASQPGGNRNGGGTGQAGGGLTGEANGTGTESRSVTSGSGSTRPVPAEFREALEMFYKSLEQKN